MNVNPRWMKLWRDVKTARGRLMMMVLALAVGVFSVGTILSAYTILNREISRNYMGTHPASAQIELDRVDDALVSAVRLRPEIAAAEAAATVSARIQVKPGEWLPLLLFVIKDFNSMQMNTFLPESGAWPPPDGSLLLERQDLTIIDTAVGQVFTVQTPNGSQQTVWVSGLVHDPGLAPAWQEQTVYGYITPATLKLLDGSSTLNILKMVVKDQPDNPAAIEKTAADLAAWVNRQGYQVEEIRIPPPLNHPHQTQMMAILSMMLIFGLMTLLLSAILTGTLIGGLLAQQVRQIGIMKTIGARTRQIIGVYLALIVLVGLAAILIGIPAGAAAGIGFAGVIANLLNFTIYDASIPAWVFGVDCLAGLLIPLLIALFPILAAARITVREAINDYGISRNEDRSRFLEKRVARLGGVDRTLLLALRNTFRRRSRLLLTLGLLTAAGAMFIASLNVKTAWENNLSDAARERPFNLEIRLDHAQPGEKVLPIIATIPGVQTVQPWNIIPAAASRPDGMDIVHTYPDGGHGSFTLRSVPNGYNMDHFTLLGGRTLQAGEKDALVFNHMAQAMFPSVKIGDRITLNINGQNQTYRLVGVIREILTPASAYVSEDTFNKAAGFTGMVNTLRITMNTQDPTAQGAISQKIERVLETNGITVNRSILDTKMDAAQSGHVLILIFSLIIMALLMGIVGALGLMSSMSSSVMERTREFGIMRTIGGRSRTIQRSVISEGVFIGLMSWIAAVLLSLPLSLAIGSLVGSIAFNLPLPLVLSPQALGIWFLVIVFGAAGASIYPARRAAHLTVRETLSYI